MRLAAPSVGVRTRSTSLFAFLALSISSILAVGTYLTARHFLVGQRQVTAARQAFVDAAYLRDGLLTSGAQVSDVLDSTSPPSGAVVVVHRDGRWYSSSLSEGAEAVPVDVREAVAAGGAAVQWWRVAGGPVLAVGVSIPAVGAEFFELSPTVELDSTLGTLALVLTVFALITTVGGALIGRAASARVVAPLDEVATAAASIAAGEMNTRLAATSDPDLAVIVGSFNTMVEALDERIRRDARFAADVSHELRSPVTTLRTTVSVLRASEDVSAERRHLALDLLDREVHRLHRALEHLLELGRLDGAAPLTLEDSLDVAELVSHALDQSRRPASVLSTGPGDLRVQGDKQLLHRALVNLFDNADVHGAGLRAVVVRRHGTSVETRVVDRGPGVPAADRERVFERFARTGSRGSRPGAGLGLSLVAETAHAHRGAVWCAETPGGGATFVLRLPSASGTCVARS